MNQAIALLPAPETKWTVKHGPMKGVVRLMNVAQFTIGRSTECEFVIVNDPKCSRKHVTIVVTPQGVRATSLSETNPFLLNGKETHAAQLQNGDVLTLGDTEVQFNFTTANPKAEMTVARPRAPHAPSARSARKNQISISPRVFLYALVGLVFLWLLTGENKKAKTVDLRTEQQIQADIEAANKLKEIADAQAAHKLDESLNGRQAQENYVRGFRDYKKGQFERSLVHFQACLALNPEHALCNRYMRLAQRRFNELIQYELVLGRKYRDQNQYRACMAAFRNILFMVKDANSSVFKEAKVNFDACKAFAEGRF